MALKKLPKQKRGECERAAEHYARYNLDCILTRRPVRTKFQSVDFFGADIVGKRIDGTHVYVQATAGQSSAVTARKKKLEVVPWHESDTVQLIQLVQTPNPANARKTDYYFRIFVYEANKEASQRTWKKEDEAVSVPREWFKAYREEDANEA